MHPTVVSDKPGDCPICGMKLVPIKPAETKPAAQSGAAQASGKYLCPMHGKVVADKPGNCPICGMKLEPVPAALLKGEVKTPSGAAPVYFCPMHPTTVSDKPGACPICQMDLEPIPDSLKAGWAKPGGAPASGAAVPGRSSVALSSEAARAARRAQRGGARDAYRPVHPHRRPGDRRRAAPRARAHEVRGLRRAPVRRLHREVREEGRPATFDLQPRAHRHAAGVPAGAARAEAARRSSQIPSVAQGGGEPG